MLAFRKTLEHSVYFLYFPPCVCPFGNFLFFIFYTVLSLHNSHHEEHLSPTEMVPVNSFCGTSPFTAVEQMWCVLARGCYAVMYLPSSGVLPVPKQTY